MMGEKEMTIKGLVAAGEGVHKQLFSARQFFSPEMVSKGGLAT
jgi:hypothetical protein